MFQEGTQGEHIELHNKESMLGNGRTCLGPHVVDICTKVQSAYCTALPAVEYRLQCQAVVKSKSCAG